MLERQVSYTHDKYFKKNEAYAPPPTPQSPAPVIIQQQKKSNTVCIVITTICCICFVLPLLTWIILIAIAASTLSSIPEVVDLPPPDIPEVVELPPPDIPKDLFALNLILKPKLKIFDLYINYII